MARDKTEFSKTPAEKGFFRSAGVLIRSRLEPLSGWSWNTAAACFIAGRGFPPLIPSILVIIAMILISLSVYIYNDVMEAEADKLNSVKKYRPLPSGEVSVKDAPTLVYVSGCCGLVMLLLVNLYSFVFGLTYFVLLIAYSHPRIRLKGIFPLMVEQTCRRNVTSCTSPSPGQRKNCVSRAHRRYSDGESLRMHLLRDSSITYSMVLSKDER